MIQVGYRKLRSGDWGIAGPAGMREGDRVRAVRKNGGAQIVTVGRIVFKGSDVTIAEMIRDSDDRRTDEDRDPEARAAAVHRAWKSSRNGADRYIDVTIESSGADVMRTCGAGTRPSGTPPRAARWRTADRVPTRSGRRADAAADSQGSRNSPRTAR